MNKPKYYVGIDAGSKGCLAVIDDKDCVVRLKDLDKDLSTYNSLIHDYSLDCYKDFYVAVEDVCGRPGQSCAANTTFMKLAGYAELVGYFIATDF